MSWSVSFPLTTNNVLGLDNSLKASAFADPANEDKYLHLRTDGTGEWQGVNAANLLLRLDGTGLVNSSFLPSYIAEIFSFSTLSAFPATGVTDAIYLDLSTSFTYRWSSAGSMYVNIASDYSYSKTASDAKYLLKAGDTMTGDLNMNSHNVTNVNNFTASSGTISTLSSTTGTISTLSSSSATISSLIATLGANMNCANFNLNNVNTGNFSTINSSNATFSSANIGALSSAMNANNQDISGINHLTSGNGTFVTLVCTNFNTSGSGTIATLSSTNLSATAITTPSIQSSTSNITFNNNNLNSVGTINTTNANVSGTLTVSTLSPSSLTTGSLTVTGSSTLNGASLSGILGMGGNAIQNCSSLRCSQFYSQDGTENLATYTNGSSFVFNVPVSIGTEAVGTINSTTINNSGTVTSANVAVTANLTALNATLTVLAVPGDCSIGGHNFFPTVLTGTIGILGTVTVTGTLSGTALPMAMQAYQSTATTVTVLNIGTVTITKSTLAISVAVSGGTNGDTATVVIWS